MIKPDKNLFIRADAGTKIGTGHVIRCITLAESLKKNFTNVFFISNQIAGNLFELIKARDLRVCKIHGYIHVEGQKINPERKRRLIENDVNQTRKIIQVYEDAENWLIVDHYGINKKWESKIRKYVNKIIVIDDLANRKHDCDVLIDQNLYKNMKKRYEKLVPRDCIQLIGPKYSLLRSEFKKARKKLKRKNGLRRILISFGGSDPKNETMKVLRGLKILDFKYKIDVVVGNSNSHKNSIKRICSNIPLWSYHEQPKNIANLMAKADLAIGGGGSMTWERCCLGLPTIVSILSDNQQKLTEELDEIGCVINLGRASKLTSNDYINTLMKVEFKMLQKMSKNCLRLVDEGGTERVIKKIQQRKSKRRKSVTN